MKRNGQGQIKTCRRKQHVKTDGMKGISNLFCGIFAVGGNYNLTRDTCEHRKIIKMSNWSTEKTKRAPRTKSIQAPNGDN